MVRKLVFVRTMLFTDAKLHSQQRNIPTLLRRQAL